MTRAELYTLDAQSELSMTVPERSYFLPIFSDEQSEEISARLWFMDSGSYNCEGIAGYECINPEAVEWFREQNYLIAEDDQSKGKGMLFIHIPLDEFVHLYNEHEFHGNAWESIACQAGNSGLFISIKEQPTV